MWPNPQEIADLVTFTEKILVENFVKDYLTTILGAPLIVPFITRQC